MYYLYWAYGRYGDPSWELIVISGTEFSETMTEKTWYQNYVAGPFTDEDEARNHFEADHVRSWAGL